jgi:UDP-3-O-[3-hydroxymyristoyl] glucosamine N-acyltransferase
MKVLLTNLTLETRTGTEIVTRDLALGLLRDGHEPCVFSPKLGEAADDIALAGVPVFRRLQDVPFRPDIIHGHHHVETTLALSHFRTVPGIFVCHDRFAWHDTPPRLNAIRRYVAVDRSCLERLVVEARIPPEQTRIILNAVDLRRFALRGPLPHAPQRALFFSSFLMSGTDLDLLRGACLAAGIELDLAGPSVGLPISRPEEVLGDYDLVFGRARCALEALAAGCAVILFSWQGLGPMITAGQVGELRAWNLGARCLQERPTLTGIASQIARYDRADAARVTESIRTSASLESAVAEYVRLYEEVLSDSAGVTTSIGDVVVALALNTGALETALREAAEPLAMAPLPRMAAQEIRLLVADRTSHVPAGTHAQIELVIENRSTETLLSRPPYPVNISYHWLDAATRDCVVFDGKRSPLTVPVLPRSRTTHTACVLAPPEPGRYVLRLTLVQEQQFWLDSAAPSAARELEITVTPAGYSHPGHETSLGAVASWVRADLLRDGEFADLGFLSDPKASMLAFVEARRFLAMAAGCAGVGCLLTTAELAGWVPPHIAVAVADDPKDAFFRIHNRLASETAFYGEDFASIVHPSARLHPRCWVDQKNVVIGAGASVEANATVLGRANIGEGSTIGHGAVIGASGYQTSNRRGELLEPVHAGSAEIGAGSQIMANAVVACGLFRESTRIGNSCHVGNGAFVSHNCLVGDKSFIGHGAIVNGNVRIGKNARIGPGANIVSAIQIAERANVSPGAIVVRDVQPHARASGSVGTVLRKMLRFKAKAGMESNNG